MITVHHLGISQSERIVWLCEELEIPYELKRYERDPITRLAPAEYKALHPLGTAPVINDGPLLMSESGAIIEYILGKHGGGRLAVKPDSADFADYVFWMHFANGSMMPNEMMNLIASMVEGMAEHPLVKALGARSGKSYALIEKRLGEAPYFAGSQFTAADVIMFFPLTTMRAFAPHDLASYPNIRAYLKRVSERPAYKRAMAKADPQLPPMFD